MPKQLDVNIDVGKKVGRLSHNWNYIGTDECNMIHTPEGISVLKEFGSFIEKPYYVRPHFLFCNGNLHGLYKWGSTNLYREDQHGIAKYDFTTFDLITDTILEHGCKPFIELGFMPYDLVDPSYKKPEHRKQGEAWSAYQDYEREYHSCPPKDYSKWQALVEKVLVHLKQRYGKEEVVSWYFELWNEPDIFYWKGSNEDFLKLYDYTVEAVESCFPEVRIGGPATCGPKEGHNSAVLLDQFLAHCAGGINLATGKKGTRLDYITFHDKGGGFPFQLEASQESPCVRTMLDQLKLGLDIMERYGYGDREVVISEADPDGWAAGGIYHNRNMNYRNTPYFPSFIASSFHQMEALARSRKADVRPLSWSFVFRGERCFEGTRAYQTQGIDKPVFHFFRMAAMLGEEEIALRSEGAQDRSTQENPWTSDLAPEVDGYATSSEDSVEVFLYSHHDNQWERQQDRDVRINLTNLPFETAEMTMWILDEDHCNSYTAWQAMGSPLYPEGDEKSALIEAGVFKPAIRDEDLAVDAREASVSVTMSTHSLVLMKITRKK
jgi:xylan 1,4-beta-xylosidase